jgi:nucleoid DNA-binding protein
MSLAKARIVEAVAEDNGFSKNKASEIVEITLEIIKSTWNQAVMF